MNLTKIWFYIALTCLVVFAGQKPYYNWDCLPYMASILVFDQDLNNADLHTAVYDNLQENVPKKTFEVLTQTEGYFENMYQNADAFHQQLPFYYIKPCYIGLSWISYKLGSNLIFATVLPSLLALWGIGFILFSWLSSMFSLKKAAIISVLLLLTVPLAKLGRLSTPDSLSCFFLLLGVYWFYAKKCWLWVALALALAILSRPDNVIFVGLFLVALVWKKYWSYQDIIFTCLLGLFAYAIPKLLLPSYSWQTLFIHSFVDQLNYPQTELVNLKVTQYVSIVVRNSFRELSISLIPLLLIFSISIWGARSKQDITTKLLLFTIISAVIVRYLLFPVLWGRFMAPYYLIALILILKQTKHLYQPVNETS
jgi:4-amino-4-deoxy-L-arabinose transferase-like glycosyltransferase